MASFLEFLEKLFPTDGAQTAKIIDKQREQEEAEKNAQEEAERRQKQQESLLRTQEIAKQQKEAQKQQTPTINTSQLGEYGLSKQTDYETYLKNLQSQIDSAINAYKTNAAGTATSMIQQSAPSVLNQYLTGTSATSAKDTDLWNRMTGYDTLSREQYQKAISNILENPYDTDYAKNLREYYGAYGDSSTQGAMAEGAAGNAGNIDSFALANANRQRLAYKTAADQAALNTYQAQTANLLGALQGMDTGRVNLYSLMQGNVDSSRAGDLSTLAQYANMVNTQAGLDTAYNQTVANVLRDAMGAYGDKYAQDLAALANRYNTDVQAQLAMYGTADTTTATPQALMDLYQVFTTEGTESTGNAPVSSQVAIELLKMLYPDSAAIIDAMFGSTSDSGF
jgi:actin-related protein